MTYDPNEPSTTSERAEELDDGNVVSMRVTVQDGKVVAAAFTCSPGYALKPDDVEALPWATAARAAVRAAPKGDKE